MIVEYGFADNPYDTNILVYNWERLAESVVKAIVDYYQVPYIPPK
jgi:N-acetylmuramoyl-L-alanine amidase